MITFLLLVFFQTETYIMCVNVFYIVRNQISAGYDKRQRISLWTPIVKIAHFGNVMSTDRHDVAKVGNFNNGGDWGNFSFFIVSNCLVSDYIEMVDTHYVSFS